MPLFDIVHISPTPLVSAPAKISNCINLYTEFNSIHIVLNDYPNALKGKFISNSILFSNNEKYCLELIKKSKIIHIHNGIPNDFFVKIKNILINVEAKFIYQVHSPQREGPLFYDFIKESNINFEEKLVVAQYQPRHYQDYKIVPNIIQEKPSINLLKKGEKPVIIFSPTHTKTGGRWNDKVCEKLDFALEGISKLNLAEVIYAKELEPKDLFLRRRFSHISIDEIVTGSYHQISLEGLSCGNMVINNADFFSTKMLENISLNKEKPPFVIANEDNISELLIDYLSNKNLIIEKQQQSYEYFKNNLSEKHLVGFYERIYKDILKG